MKYTLLEQLLENELTVSDIVDMIQRDCKPFLKASNGLQLFRGIKASDKDDMIRQLANSKFLIAAVRNNRQPKDSSSALHDALNVYFRERVGIPVRSACIFTTGNSGTAGLYGSMYLIFPIGEFHYAWSEDVIDAYYEFHFLFDQSLDSDRLTSVTADTFKKAIRNVGIYLDEAADRYHLPKGMTFAKFSSKFVEEFQNVSSHMPPVAKILAQAFLSLIDANDFESDITMRYRGRIISPSEITKLQSFVIDKTANYKFDTQFPRAIKSWNEIMIVCNKYYAIQVRSPIYKKVVAELGLKPANVE